ncbi:ABC transporter permease [Mesoterricola sediminis]|uniref:Transport permease protein n=1 Tax=Mesoterricola sediminis TaxID=2927980 RepID=A0AA48GM25_9BACT|nr:ABC transporter permease [Mesoterricola sediminis]BDU75581.1 transport permease protein [Mesoterricola sediminis]
MMGLLAIAERELRKFFHAPLLLFVALLGPLVQLLLMGHAFGGRIVHCPVGLVDLDHGSQAVRLRTALQSVATNGGALRLVEVGDETSARRAVASGRLKAAVIIPARFTARSLKGGGPVLGLVVDNTDAFVSGALGQTMQDVVAALNAPAFPPRLGSQVTLESVEVFPYVRYIQFLLPGILALAIFLSVMFGGGMLYNEDRIRGVHEGFLVTPIRSLDLVGGMVLAGTVKATICGLLVALLGSAMAGLPILQHPVACAWLAVLVVTAGFAFNALMFLLMGRIHDPMTPKVLAGLLNTLLFFPSGAIYPLEAFPGWLRAMAAVNPMTYAVHGFRALLLRHVGAAEVGGDILVLALIGTVALAVTARTFRRTL